MIGIIPGTDVTYQIESTFSDASTFIEGKLYVDEKDDRIYMYSSEIKRPCVQSGFYPIYDGKKKYISKYANEKYFSKDAICYDLKKIIEKVDNKHVNRISSLQRHCSDNIILTASVGESDNSFTQCIKVILTMKEYTLTDLAEMSGLSEKILKGYYNILNKISFMRLDRFYIWMKNILHMNFKVKVWDDKGNLLIKYNDGENTFDTGIVTYDDIINSDTDFMKKIINILMRMKSITKAQLNASGEEDYTINNLLILLNSHKPFSAQLFSRFMKMVNYSYNIEIFDGDKQLFVYEE